MAYTTPIYDRTTANVTSAKTNQASSTNLKGALNISDLNRIELNIEYLQQQLLLRGYHVDLEGNKTNWLMVDYIYLTDIDRIRQNVINLVASYYDYLATPTIVLGNDKLLVGDINDLEKVIFDINQILERMVAYFRYCGTFYSAQGVILP